ncbi:hypothetical protein J2S09_001598 [Bacillus fengqiuensis]|nr:hypothetical protein [Bacillus fengqiuensis]
MNQYKEELLSLTNKMVEYNESAFKRLEENKVEDQLDTYFYKQVKPYVEVFDEQVHRWSVMCERWIEDTQPKYIHKQQIETAVDNLRQVVLQSFYVSSRNVRIKKMIHANQYTLVSILESF